MPARLLVVLVVLLAVPAAARAATVEFTYHQADYGGVRPYETSFFRVLGDEGSDDLQIINMPGGLLAVSDPSRPVTFRPSSTSQPAVLCTTLDEHHVQCQGIHSTAGNNVDVDVDAGGGDDRVTVDGQASLRALFGGAGNDVLQGGSGSDTIDGGPGDDVIDGGAGDDVINDSEGRDEQRGGEGNDRFVVRRDRLGDGETLDGGPGGNFLEVGGIGDEPFEVDLAAGRITSPRGTTSLSGFRSAEVSGPNAVLLGDDGPNVLYAGTGGRADGRGGDDYLLAIGGPATLLGGDGNDKLETDPGGHRYSPAPGSTLDGGPGDDRIHSQEPARVACGPGRDVVSAEFLQWTRPADCEGSATWFGFLGTIAVTGSALQASMNLYSNESGVQRTLRDQRAGHHERRPSA